jgi:hypothetical protein
MWPIQYTVILKLKNWQRLVRLKHHEFRFK